MDGNQQQALDLAAAETYRRIDVDLAEAPEPLQPLLAEIRGRVHDVRYRPPTLGRQRRSGPEGLARAFQAYFGETPLDYVRGARLETSMRLLRDSDLTIGAVALLVGYSDLPGFRRAFRRWFSMPPQRFRDKAQRIAKRTGWPDDEILSFRLWLRAAAGEEAAVERLRDWVRVLHPRAKAPEPREASSEERFWRRLAETLWTKISAMPPAKLRRVLRHELVVGHPALFHLLIAESRRAEDPGRALELAELASATVEGSAAALAELVPGLRFLARNRLAEARQSVSQVTGC
jgi:AraC-like DNA-binding protein